MADTSISIRIAAPGPCAIPRRRGKHKSTWQAREGWRRGDDGNRPAHDRHAEEGARIAAGQGALSMRIKVRLDTYGLSAGKIAQEIVAGTLGTNLLPRSHC